MKTIGEQAKEFREARRWTTKEMAAACKTSRQNIETLEAKGARTPRYIKDLARVMGTTVDVLMEGRYRLGGTPAEEPAPKALAMVELAPETDDVTRALRVLGSVLARSDKVTRSAVAPLLSLLAAEPHEIENIVSNVKKLLPTRELARTSQDERSTGLVFRDLGSGELNPDGKSTVVQGTRRRAK
jgi:transcriptional regulator with XRE-family HTH domain